MKKTSEMRATTEAEKCALRWFLELKDNSPPTPERWRGFLDWLRESPDHERLLSQYESMWDQLRELETSPEFIGYAVDDVDPASFSRAGSRRLRLVQYVAAGLAACVALFLVAWPFSHPERYSTAVGKQRLVELADGSRVLLNTDTVIDVNFLPWTRRVLLRRGEAFFTVSHNQWRPFWVYAGAGGVRAIGTRFIVREDAANVMVTLVDGRVLVSTRTRVNGETVGLDQILAPGQVANFDAGGLQTNARSVDLSSVTDWTHGRLNFTDARLDEVVRELNRYTDQQINIADPELAALKVSAYFEVEHMSAFLAELPRLLNIEQVRQGGTIQLVRSSRQKNSASQKKK